MKKKKTASQIYRAKIKKARKESDKHLLMVSLGYKPRKGKVFICPVCKKNFYVKPSHIYRAKCCSHKCNSINQTTKVLMICMECGKKYYRHKSQNTSKTNFCSNICFRKYVKYNTPKGKDSIFWRGGNRREKCRVCGIAISNWTKNKLCKPCFSKSMKGKNNPRWKGKKPRYHHACYTKKYKTWRTKVFKRDDYKCQECGEKKYIIGHHIKFWSKYPILRYRIYNGVTLCKKCHKYIHWWEREWEKLSKKYKKHENFSPKI